MSLSFEEEASQVVRAIVAAKITQETPEGRVREIVEQVCIEMGYSSEYAEEWIADTLASMI